MTNREWLESLSDEELAAWMCNNYIRNVNTATGTFETITITDLPTGIDNLKMSFSHSQLGLTKWLGEESYEKKF